MRPHLSRWVSALVIALAATAAAARDTVRLWEEVYVRVRAGATVQARFHLSVERGYCVVAAGVAGATSLRPLTLRIPEVPGVRTGAPGYPAPNLAANIPGQPEFAAHEGTLAISLPVTVPAQADWQRKVIRGTLEYQACSAAECLPPAALPVAIEVEVRLPGSER